VGRVEAELLRAYGATQAATTAVLHAQQLEDALRARESQFLTPAEAENESGYSRRRLRELEAEGRLQNHGRKGSPRYRCGKLPKRPAHSSGTFDARAEARAITSRTDARSP